MDRRDFIKQSTLLSIGGLLIPSTFLSAWRKDTLFENINYNGKVICFYQGGTHMNFKILKSFYDKFGDRL